MAWQTPKTDWTGSDGVRYGDLNRIEGNAEALRILVDEALFVATQRVSLSDLPVGAEFALYENGVLVPFIKVQENYSGTNRTLVVRKSSYTAARYNEGSFGLYSDSYIDTLVNEGYINYLDSATRAVLTDVNITVAAASGTTTIARKVFLLSRTEYNFSGSPVEGAAITGYFYNPDRRIATYDGMPYEHWTRTALYADEEANFVTNTGSIGTGNQTAFVAGVRPAFTLPSTFNVVASVPSTANVMATAEVISE